LDRVLCRRSAWKTFSNTQRPTVDCAISVKLCIVATSSRQWKTNSTRRYSSHRKSARASKEIASARAATVPAALATHSRSLWLFARHLRRHLTPLQKSCFLRFDLPRDFTRTVSTEPCACHERQHSVIEALRRPPSLSRHTQLTPRIRCSLATTHSSRRCRRQIESLGQPRPFLQRIIVCVVWQKHLQDLVFLAIGNSDVLVLRVKMAQWQLPFSNLLHHELTWVFGSGA
jgi:hypothetical protein